MTATASGPPGTGRAASHGLAAPDFVEELRSQVGATFRPGRPPFNAVATSDAIRHFAWSTGSDSPLHHDEAHAAATRWKHLVAPPYFFETMGEADEGGLADVERVLPIDRPFVQAGGDTRWFRPIQPGDRVAEVARLCSVDERTSARFGRSVAARYRHVYRERVSRRLLVVSDRSFVFLLGGAASAAPRQGEGQVQPRPRDPDQWGERTAVPKVEGAPTFEDLPDGGVLGAWRSGPVTIAEIVAFHIGWGLGGPFPWGTGRAGLDAVDAHPRWFSRGTTGAREVAVRVHWDSLAAARRGGRPHLYGQQQASLLANYVAGLAGDDGWVARLAVEHRGPVNVGDVVVIEGAVRARRPPHTVEVDVRCVDGEGRVTGTARATVLVRSSACGVPALPEPPDDPFEEPPGA